MAISIGVVVTLLLLATTTTFFSFGQQANGVQNAADHKYQWDFILISISGSTATVTSGGSAVASAEPPLGNITITGEGTFVVGDPNQVTGGGTWSLSAGGHGTFKVTQLISFVQNPGTLISVLAGLTVHDKIDGGATDSRAGLGIFRVHYSDGSNGVLTLACDLTGNGVSGYTTGFEGITITKGGADYFLPNDPLGTSTSLTVYHILDG